MTERLETALEKISTIPNPINSSLIQEFYQFMTYNRKSDIAIKRTILRLLCFLARNLLQISPSTIFKRKRKDT
jgi:hypothetical protein